MEIRKAEIRDVDLLVENRLEFVCLIRNIENIEEFKKRTKEYLEKHINDGSIISYIAVEDDKIVSSCILSIYKTLPMPSCLSGKAGVLLNVYTLEKYRRQGLAYKLLTNLIKQAKKVGVGKILLDYTDDGHALYIKLGFKELDRQMVLKLD